MQEEMTSIGISGCLRHEKRILDVDPIIMTVGDEDESSVMCIQV